VRSQHAVPQVRLGAGHAGFDRRASAGFGGDLRQRALDDLVLDPARDDDDTVDVAFEGVLTRMSL